MKVQVGMYIRTHDGRIAKVLLEHKVCYKTNVEIDNGYMEQTIDYIMKYRLYNEI